MQPLVRFIQRIFLSATFILTMCNTLWAQAAAAPAADEKGYILQYTLVFLAVFLAIFVACRPGRRQTETKLQKQFEDEPK